MSARSASSSRIDSSLPVASRSSSALLQDRDAHQPDDHVDEVRRLAARGALLCAA